MSEKPKKPSSTKPATTKAASPKKTTTSTKKIETVDEPRRNRKVGTWVIVVAVAVLLSLAAVCGYLNLNARKGAKVESTTVLPSKVSTMTATAVMTTWRLVYSDYENNRWFGEGIPEIRDAKTDQEASNAAFTWLERVKPDPNLLVPTIKMVLDKDVDQTTLFKDGWATPEAVQLVAEMQLALGQATIVAEEAPANGTNSGVDQGVVVSSATPGIRGDRRAIKITLSNGRVFWVMARCGNVVTTGRSSFPPGKTELQPKDASQDPAARGNAPIGGGRNRDPGPGQYIPPSGMVQPPATPRVNPPAPVIAPPTGSKPDPTPAPAPEPQAPTPDAPAIGYSPAPGTK